MNLNLNHFSVDCNGVLAMFVEITRRVVLRMNGGYHIMVTDLLTGQCHLENILLVGIIKMVIMDPNHSGLESNGGRS